jgi:DNA-binding transcriptional ArsR family regulator
MSRFGVMKHLAVLEQAGLVVTHRDGRTKLHYLNPVPIQEIHDRWIAKYAAATTATLTELRRDLESGSA